MNDPQSYLAETRRILNTINTVQILETVNTLQRIRTIGGRVFCIGNGGGQAHASHMANDLRKIGHIESYAWMDNPAEATAWINDRSWGSAISQWLHYSHFNESDALFVFSVGGGTLTTSLNLTGAIDYAQACHANILGIVGLRGGYLADHGKPIIIPSTSTPHVEGLQSVLAHLIITTL